jgi:NTE family protein
MDSEARAKDMAAKIGFVLGSGAARGWAHIGVLRVLGDAGIVPDVVCGTSIGAVVGALYVAGGLARLERWARALTRRRVGALFDFQLGHGGLIGGQRVLAALEPRLGGVMMEHLPLPFACVATDLDTGHEVWLREGRVLDAVRASYAVPGIFPAVRVGGHPLVDGALVNPVPVSLCRAMGAELVIASDVNTDITGHGAAHEEKVELWAACAEEDPAAGFIRSYFSHRHDTPSAFTALTRSLHIIQDRMGRMRLAEDPPDVHVCPKVGQVGPVEFHRAEECIAAGESAAYHALDAIRAAIAAAGQSPPPPKRNGNDGG